jgi:hypothetical protein
MIGARDRGTVCGLIPGRGPNISQTPRCPARAQWTDALPFTRSGPDRTRLAGLIRVGPAFLSDHRALVIPDKYLTHLPNQPAIALELGSPLRLLIRSGGPFPISGSRRLCSASSRVAAPDATFLRALWNQNASLVQSLEAYRPDLVTRRGVHFASVLASVFEAQLAKLTAQNSSEPVNIGPVDKSALAIATPKRISG